MAVGRETQLKTRTRSDVQIPQRRALPSGLIDITLALGHLAIIATHAMTFGGSVFKDQEAFKKWFPKQSSPAHYVFNYGMLGVEVFLFLSGFLACRALLRAQSMDGPRFSKREFYKHRLLRLYPTLLSTSLLTMLLRAAENPKHVEMSAVLRDLTFTTNLYPASTAMNSMLWSTAVDFQCYLLAPFALPLLQKLVLKSGIRPRSRYIAMIIVASTAMRYFCNTFMDTALFKSLMDMATMRLYSSILFRSLPFVLGMLLYINWDDRRSHPQTNTSNFMWVPYALLMSPPVSEKLMQHFGYHYNEWLFVLLLPQFCGFAYHILDTLFDLAPAWQSRFDVIATRGGFSWIARQSFTSYLLHSPIVGGIVIAAHGKAEGPPSYLPVMIVWVAASVISLTVSWGFNQVVVGPIDKALTGLTVGKDKRERREAGIKKDL
ncbi:acyltransferase 3 [Fimicolochytrium jonesii]|uniref:acyltransferase 3 n=1 Tax=Fimicolochytrium jonesii TaxID=1396493 RepID=UPI0022FE3827|nr:acyltransferase 3 [Fimicolochytrium jonesii]KAI8822655.1 acyltransferase 3 [Fimicolochytrium jonesii]